MCGSDRLLICHKFVSTTFPEQNVQRWVQWVFAASATPTPSSFFGYQMVFQKMIKDIFNRTLLLLWVLFSTQTSAQPTTGTRPCKWFYVKKKREKTQTVSRGRPILKWQTRGNVIHRSYSHSYCFYCILFSLYLLYFFFLIKPSISVDSKEKNFISLRNFFFFFLYMMINSLNLNSTSSGVKLPVFHVALKQD